MTNLKQVPVSSDFVQDVCIIKPIKQYTKMADGYNAGRAAQIVKPNIHTDDNIRAVYLEYIQVNSSTLSIIRSSG